MVLLDWSGRVAPIFSNTSTTSKPKPVGGLGFGFNRGGTQNFFSLKNFYRRPEEPVNPSQSVVSVSGSTGVPNKKSSLNFFFFSCFDLRKIWRKATRRGEERRGEERRGERKDAGERYQSLLAIGP
jgi:hypothetical protein